MAQKRRYTVVTAPFGRLYIAGNEEVIDYIGLQKPLITCSLCDSIPLLQHTAWDIEQYLGGYIDRVRPANHLPLSPFQKDVFTVIGNIPYGETRTYAAVAAALGKPHAVRAVMHTCLSNPLWLAFPTHRAILSDELTPVNERCWDALSVLRSMERRYLDKS